MKSLKRLASKSTQHHHETSLSHSLQSKGLAEEGKLWQRECRKHSPEPQCSCIFFPPEHFSRLRCFSHRFPRNGECSHVTTLMILTLLVLYTSSCFFFHLTDSFKGPDGKIYYGFVTPRGLAVFKHSLGVDVPKDEKYKVGLTDFVHAIMSVMVFMAIALSDHRVTNCLFPGQAKDMEQVKESFPLMVGIVCGGLFFLFPNTRYGMGCMLS